jgi:hypothetical protein
MNASFGHLGRPSSEMMKLAARRFWAVQNPGSSVKPWFWRSGETASSQLIGHPQALAPLPFGHLEYDGRGSLS